MRHCFLFLLIFGFLNVFSQKNVPMEQFISDIGNASVGINVKDLTTDQNIIDYNSSLALTPASILKLVTTATALETLGSDYHFKTILAVDENNPQHLIIHGYGDPTLGSEYLGQNSTDFLDAWISKIRDNISVDSPITITVIDDYFGYSGVSSKWLQEDLGNYFAAGSYGISVFDNTYKLYLNTTNKNERPEIVNTIPNMDNIILFQNMLTINTDGKDRGYINGNPYSTNRYLVGDIPFGKSSFILKGDIPAPGLVLGQILAAKLSENGFQIKNVKTTEADFYTKTKENIKENPFYTHLSIPLSDIIRIINVRSNNHYTEHLIRIVGKLNSKDIYKNPLTEGIETIRTFWESKNIDCADLFMYDGCGLAPSDKISSKLLCDILTYMFKNSPNAQTFMASLPRAGQEGTIKNVLKGTRLEGKVQMKSGSIADVQCFAGYYVNDGKKYAFSIMVNNYNSPRKNIVRAIEYLLLSIF